MKILTILFNIIVTILIMAFFIWIGWKGIIGFTIGAGLAFWLMLTKNWMVRSIVEWFGAEDNINSMLNILEKNKK